MENPDKENPEEEREESKPAYADIDNETQPPLALSGQAATTPPDDDAAPPSSQPVSKDPEFLGIARNFRPIERTAPLMTDEKYLKERVDGQINYFNSKSKWNQTRYKKIKKWELSKSV